MEAESYRFEELLKSVRKVKERKCVYNSTRL